MKTAANAERGRAGISVREHDAGHHQPTRAWAGGGDARILSLSLENLPGRKTRSWQPAR